MKYQNIITALFLLFTSNLVFGQAQIGLRFQTGIPNYSSESQYLVSAGGNLDYQLTLKNISNSQSVGLYSQFKFGFLYFQPEVLYTKYNVSFEVDNYRSESLSNMTTTETEFFQQLDFPINAGLRFKNFRLGGGPIFSLIQKLKSDISQLDNIDKVDRTISAGFQGGIGYDYKTFRFDIKYQRNFNSATDHLQFNNRIIKSKTNPTSIQFGLAVALGNK